MSVVVEGREDIDLDLTGDLSTLKNKAITIKEGVSYRIKITFKVNREIVSGLKFLQVTHRKGIRVDKSDLMVGSYGPKSEAHEYRTPAEEAPKGMIAVAIIQQRASLLMMIRTSTLHGNGHLI
ncbi:hypothetical protein OS493_010602 [Desmophyllum pertusum]|uniref:Uncharacterized protein n=1 Tax=Desmophyllum pertusum TaxID=174260 RepID=A0A9W9ZS82_9CNID|nr:hypothetical protein OS493_010602 [Desmophyllum pertusum]